MNNHQTAKTFFDDITDVTFQTVVVTLAVYTVAIAGAEIVGAFISVFLGTLAYAVLLFILINHYAFTRHSLYQGFLLVLALVPLLRILSVAMPIRQVPQVYWYAMVGGPLLIGVMLTARVLRLSLNDLGLQPQAWLPQLPIALSGLPLGIVAFLLVRPKPLVASFYWLDIAIAAVILMIFVGFVEEIIFRGLLQQAMNETFGRATIFYSSILFAIVYLGSLSVSYIFFMGLVGFFFAWCVAKTESIWGVVLSHSVLSIGMMVVWPFVLT